MLLLTGIVEIDILKNFLKTNLVYSPSSSQGFLCRIGLYPAPAAGKPAAKSGNSARPGSCPAMVAVQRLQTMFAGRLKFMDIDQSLAIFEKPNDNSHKTPLLKGQVRDDNRGFHKRFSGSI